MNVSNDANLLYILYLYIGYTCPKYIRLHDYRTEEVHVLHVHSYFFM